MSKKVESGRLSDGNYLDDAIGVLQALAESRKYRIYLSPNTILIIQSEAESRGIIPKSLRAGDRLPIAICGVRVTTRLSLDDGSWELHRLAD